jgi:hypothetical protein
MRLIRRNINTRIEDPSKNLEIVINVPYDHKKVGQRDGRVLWNGTVYTKLVFIL